MLWSAACLLVLPWSVPAPAQTTPAAPRAAVTQRLEALLAAVPPETRIGLVVADAEDGAVWFARNGELPLKPASVQKLLVTAAALERFGPDFQYRTRAYLQGRELWIVGAGDPALGDARLAERHQQPRDALFDACAAALKARGVTALSGIVLDDTVFEPPGRHPDWPGSQADRWYQAPVGGLNYNDNCLNISVAVLDGRVAVTSRPGLPAEWIQNEMRVGREQRPIVRRRSGQPVFELGGTIRTGGDLAAVSADDPTDFFGAALQYALEQRGIKLRGSVVRQKVEPARLPSESLLHTHATALPDVLWRCNTFSQNLFAECLLKTLAAYAPEGRPSGVPGSWQAGRRIALDTLGHVGVDLEDAALRDGSGLSHSNRLTAAQVVGLLVRMKHHRHADVFLTSLAAPGKPGTMRRRYDDPLLRGRLRGKTGSISGVRTLAGYLTRPDGRTLAFAVLINGKTDRNLPSAVCKAIVAGEPSPEPR